MVSEEQNLTLTVSEDSVGTYLCQAETDGFAALTSRPAEVLMTGPPKITTNLVQVRNFIQMTLRILEKSISNPLMRPLI